MRKYFQLAFLGFSITVFTLCSKKDSPNTGPQLPEKKALADDFFVNAKSAPGTEENPRARREYWTRLQVDPATGVIPPNIRHRELQFAQTLPKKSDPRLKNNIEEWTSIGPYNVGGRSRSAAFDISNEEVIISGGVSGGIWKSQDGGESWGKKTPIQSIHSVTTIAQDTRPGKTNIWYYGTGELQGNSARAPFAPFRGDGLFKSTDSGETWSQLASTGLGTVTVFNSQFQYVWKVLTNPNNTAEDEVFAAIVGAIVRSTDGGENWQLVLGEELQTTDSLDLNTAAISRFTDIELTADGIFYAVLSSVALNDETYIDHGVYRSTDGINWNEITSIRWPNEYSRVVIATSVSNPDLLYFLGDDGDEDFLFRYEYLAGDGAGFGGRWEDLSQNIPRLGGDLGDYDDQDSYNMVLKVHPSDENILYLGGTNLYMSTNGFSNTSATAWIGGYDTANDFSVFQNHYVDQHDLYFSQTDPDKMLSVNDGGIFQSTTNREESMNWQPLNNGMITSQSYVIGFDGSTSAGKVIIGFQDNGTHISTNPDANTRWTRFIGGDGTYCDITRNEEYIYASFQESQVYRFTIEKDLQKTSFARVDPIGGGNTNNQGYLFVNPFTLDPNNENVMYLAGGDVVWRNYNLSQIPSGSQNKTSLNWEKIPGTAIDENQITAISASTVPKEIVYYGTSEGKLFKMTNAMSLTPEIAEITSNNFPETAYLISIAIDRTNADHLMIAFSNYNTQSIFYSQNGGDTFESVSGNLEEFPDGSGSGPSVRWVDIYPKRDGGFIYFAATSTGLYSTDELEGNETLWVQEGATTIGNVVGVMVKHRPADGTVFFATHGNGAFQAYFDDPADDISPQPENNFYVDTAYPNPFTDEVNISFNLPENGIVRSTVINMNGQTVKSLLLAKLYAGKNFITWDGTNNSGVRLTPGVYIVRFEYNERVTSTKILFND